MSVTISNVFPGHWKTTYTTTTTVTVVGGVGTAFSDTTASDSFERGVNQWGQSGVKIDFYNESKKVIKYIDFEVVPLNAVNDPLEKPVVLNAAGPIKGHSVSRKIWSFLWTNYSVKSVRVQSCSIQYMDGTTEKQSVHPGDKPMQFDSYVGHSLAFPLVLLIMLLSAAAWAYFGNTRILPQFTGISFALLVILSFAALIFSKIFINRVGSAIAGAAALIASGLTIYVGQRVNVLFSFSPLFNFKSYPSLFHDMAYSGSDRFLRLIAYGGTVILLLAVVLCAAGVLKKNKTRFAVILTIELVFFSLFFLSFFMTDTARRLAGYNWLMALVVVVLWTYLGTIAMLLRENYDVVP